MASNSTHDSQDASGKSSVPAFNPVADVLENVRWLASWPASLTLTVILLNLSILIILFGTLAQVDMDMWEVISIYFRSWVAWIDVKVLMPRTWFPHARDWFAEWRVAWIYDSKFPFPGGAIIGLLLSINLFSAGVCGVISWVLTNLIRNKKQPNWLKLLGGAATLSLGVGITTAIILHGHNHEGLQGAPPVSWETLWSLTKAGIYLTTLGLFGGFVWQVIRDPKKLAELIVLGTTGTIAAAISIYLLVSGSDTYVGESSMRILWQLTQASFAAGVLWLGFMPLFGKRAGVALLHSGVALLMFGQYFVGQYDVEEQMAIQEGEVANFGQDIRTVELAVVNPHPSSKSDEDEVVAIPLYHTGSPTRFLDKRISHENLPFDLKVVKYYKNSEVKLAGKGDKTVATSGRLKEFIASERRKGSGTDMDAGVDIASAYVEVLKKGTDDSLGTYLVSQEILPLRDGTLFNFEEKVEVAGVTYDLALRFQRNYKPYTIKLEDIRKEDYIGTNTPRDYSSIVHLKDSRYNVDRPDIRIWMNNPLRYAGETFYQSNYRKDPQGHEHTTLQVVRNSGWMIPYVACMLVVVGMCVHFVEVLLRFLRRQSAAAIMRSMSSVGGFERTIFATMIQSVMSLVLPSRDRAKLMPTAKTQEKLPRSEFDVFEVIAPILVVAVFGAWFLSNSRPLRSPEIAVMKDRKDEKEEITYLEPQTFDIYEFGRLPLLAGGRVKPFDTLARNSLRVIAGREEFKDEKGKRQPAILWMLDVISGSEAGDLHKVFRIDNPEVLQTLGLKAREGFLYSREEMRLKLPEFGKQVRLAHEQKAKHGAENLSVYQRKILEVFTRFQTYSMLDNGFFRLPLSRFLPTEQEMEIDPASARKKMLDLQKQVSAFLDNLEKEQVPLTVPLRGEGKKVTWKSYAEAWVMGALRARFAQIDPDPAIIAMDGMLMNYVKGDAKAFNKGIRDYRELLEKLHPKELEASSSMTNRFVESRFGSFYGFEAYFNHVAPFYQAAVFYLAAFVLATAAWLGWRQPLNKASFFLILLAFAIHTGALAARIYISGRPPVTNLYSSAVFIGWGCVAAGLLIEVMFGMGIGNVIAAKSGFAALVIAHMLAADGDTFTVLQAVLDTQFWLATHVVCITLGYTATFVAGFMGLRYVLSGVLTPTLSPELGKELYRMTYGTICFAIFFSFFGTVLGGLWADDSWGRFWGWDPKENGALIIVLWNAVVLHSRWGGLVKERGMANLAVMGNVVTAWSWFGVNELGKGLHSYGFTEGRLMYLGLFVFSQFLVIGLGLFPRSMWWSCREHGTVNA